MLFGPFRADLRRRVLKPNSSPSSGPPRRSKLFPPCSSHSLIKACKIDRSGHLNETPDGVSGARASDLFDRHDACGLGISETWTSLPDRPTGSDARTLTRSR